MASQSDVLSGGISSALRARMFREELATAEAGKRRAEAEADTAAAEKVIAQAEAAPYQMADVQSLIARSLRANLGWKETEANALRQFYPSRLRMENETIGAQLPELLANAAMFKNQRIGTGIKIAERVMGALPSLSGSASLINAISRELDARRGVETTESGGGTDTRGKMYTKDNSRLTRRNPRRK